MLTLYFSKGALANFLDDCVFAELGCRVDPLFLGGGRHCEREREWGRMWGRERVEERDYKQIAMSRGCKMK